MNKRIAIGIMVIFWISCFATGQKWADAWIKQETYYLDNRKIDDWSLEELEWWMDKYGIERIKVEKPIKNWKP